MCLSLPFFKKNPSLPLLCFNTFASFNQAEKVAPPAVRHISAEVVPMGPPPPPKPRQTRDSAFMEKLHAVDEELASSPVCVESFQVSSGSVAESARRSRLAIAQVGKREGKEPSADNEEGS